MGIHLRFVVCWFWLLSTLTLIVGYIALFTGNSGSNQLYLRRYTLNVVDGTLAALSTAGGLRRAVRERAISLDLSGSIQRTWGKNAAINCEGTADALNAFEDFLIECQHQAVFETFSIAEERAIRRPLNTMFVIMSDGTACRTPTNPQGVVTGRYSDHEHELASNPSGIST